MTEMRQSESYLADRTHEHILHTYIFLTYPTSLKAQAFIQKHTLKVLYCVPSHPLCPADERWGRHHSWSTDTKQSRERQSWKPVLRQHFSNSNVNQDDLEVLVKSRLWLSKTRRGHKSLHFQSASRGCICCCSADHRLRSNPLSDKINGNAK